MSVSKISNFPLRFRNKTQKSKAERRAKKQNLSLNGYILSLIDADILESILSKGTVPLPSDYVNWKRIGFMKKDGTIQKIIPPTQ